MDKELTASDQKKLQDELKQRLHELGILPEITPPPSSRCHSQESLPNPYRRKTGV
jgi:hypothetical protein